MTGFGEDDLTVVEALRSTGLDAMPVPSAELVAWFAAPPLPAAGSISVPPRLRRVLAWFGGLGLAAHVALGAGVAVASVGLAGTADVLPGPVQEAFDQVVGRDSGQDPAPDLPDRTPTVPSPTSSATATDPGTPDPTGTAPTSSVAPQTPPAGSGGTSAPPQPHPTAPQSEDHSEDGSPGSESPDGGDDPTGPSSPTEPTDDSSDDSSGDSEPTSTPSDTDSPEPDAGGTEDDPETTPVPDPDPVSPTD